MKTNQKNGYWKYDKPSRLFSARFELFLTLQPFISLMYAQIGPDVQLHRFRSFDNDIYTECVLTMTFSFYL